MKLLKHRGREYGDKIYYKYTVVIPNKIIKLLKLKGGEELSVNVKGKKMIIEEK